MPTSEKRPARRGAAPRTRGPAARRARTLLLSGDGPLLVLIVLLAVGAGLGLLLGLLDLTAAP